MKKGEFFRTMMAYNREQELRKKDKRIAELQNRPHDEVLLHDMELMQRRIAKLQNLADARLKDRLIMQESNVTAHKRIAELGRMNKSLQGQVHDWSGTCRDLDKRIAELEGKIANPSWSDFMEICDNFLAHYPPDIFTGASGDPAPLFVVALRKAKQELEDK